jgi:biotin carboxyl carrier protein
MPWTRPASRRCAVSFEIGTGDVVFLWIRTHPTGGLFNVAVQPTPGATILVEFREVYQPHSRARHLSATVVPQAHGTARAEQLYIFSRPHASTVLCCAPAWAEVLSADTHSLARGALRAPILNLVVDVRFAIGERVEKGQAVVMLERMKTEMVLRAPGDGAVKAVGCAKGEMVEGSRELVEIEESGEA